MAEQNLDFNIIAHTQGMEQIANLINRVGALEAETKKLTAANTGLAKSTESVVVSGKRYNTALDAQSKSIRNSRMGVSQLGMQFNDLATSISTGASPVQAFNQQIGQIGWAMSLMTGRVGMLGRLIAGPLGIALIGATVLMNQFKGKTEETEDSTANFGDYAIATFQTIGEQISNGLKPAMEALGPAISALNPVVEALQTVFENLGYVGKTVANFILRAFVTAINAIAILASNSFSMVAEGVLNVVNGYPADYTSSYSNFNAGTNDVKIGLIGCNKDHTSYYLKLFPTWGSEGVEFLDPINATDIRDTFFDTGIITANDLPNSTIVFLMKFAKSDTYTVLRTARIWHVNYKRNVQKYPRIEHTVDSVVVQSGHVLLIQRRAEPGKGLWAMPGGFLNVDERMLDGALRELREETKLAVPEPVLRGSLVTSKTYDDPKRSERGRLITQAYLFSLTKTEKLPKIKGSDDAAKAKWVPISELRPIEMFEDHYFIIKDLLGKL